MPLPSLERVIAKLHSERMKLQRQLGAIESTFAKFGINVPGSAAKARRAKRKVRVAAAKTKAKAKKGGKRKKFKQTAEKYILGLLNGGKALSTAEINKRWAGVGRGSGANVTLGMMVKDKKIKRAKAKGVRGSVYSLA